MRALNRCSKQRWAVAKKWRHVSVQRKRWATNVALGQPCAASHPHLLREDELAPGVTKAEYGERRQRLADQLPPRSLAIIASATTTYMSNDIPYPFRQNTDFSYLTGFEEPDSMLLLAKDEVGTARSTLLVRPKNATRELWDGARTGPEHAVSLLGIDEAYSVEQAPKVLRSQLGSCSAVYYEPKSVPSHPMYGVVGKALADHAISKPVAVEPLVQRLRLIKSPAEQQLMRLAGNMSAGAFRMMMGMSHANVSEHALDALLEHGCRLQGCKRLAYPPVVAGGSRALTLHYVNNDAIVRDDEMVLVDGGGEFWNYASDITRTYPVNGTMTPPQRELYEAVLSVQERLIKMVVPDGQRTLEMLQKAFVHLMGEQLLSLGLWNGSANTLPAAVYRFCPHGVGHWLGMDTHDTSLIPNSEVLQPGMVFTIEPGIYMPMTDDIPEHYRGIGIRIEDDILVNESGCEVLSSGVPKHVDEMQALIGQQVPQHSRSDEQQSQ